MGNQESWNPDGPAGNPASSQGGGEPGFGATAAFGQVKPVASAPAGAAQSGAVSSGSASADDDLLNLLMGGSKKPPAPPAPAEPVVHRVAPARGAPARTVFSTGFVRRMRLLPLRLQPRLRLQFRLQRLRRNRADSPLFSAHSARRESQPPSLRVAGKVHRPLRLQLQFPARPQLRPADLPNCSAKSPRRKPTPAPPSFSVPPAASAPAPTSAPASSQSGGFTELFGKISSPEPASPPTLPSFSAPPAAPAAPASSGGGGSFTQMFGTFGGSAAGSSAPPPTPAFSAPAPPPTFAPPPTPAPASSQSGGFTELFGKVSSPEPASPSTLPSFTAPPAAPVAPASSGGGGSFTQMFGTFGGSASGPSRSLRLRYFPIRLRPRI